MSPGLSASLAAHRPAALPHREALILALFANHPGLLGVHAEELAGLDLSSRDMSALRDGLIGLASDGTLDLDHVDERLARDDLQPVWRRINAMAAIASLWLVRRDAAESEVDLALRQALGLQRKTSRLHRELQLAELALAEDPTELNLARMRDIQAELASLEGQEAAIEGFGSLSGMATQPV